MLKLVLSMGNSVQTRSCCMQMAPVHDHPAVSLCIQLKGVVPLVIRGKSDAHLAPFLGGIHGQDDDQPLAVLQPGLVRRQRVLLPREPADVANNHACPACQ